MTRSRADCEALDRADPLAAFRDRFALPRGVIYLDGNSLGPLPRATPARLREVAETEWGEALIRAWNQHDWIGLPLRIGEKIGRLIGAAPESTIVADSTSINAFKALAAALALRPGSAGDRLRGGQLPDRPLHRAGSRRPARRGPHAAAGRG